MNKVAALVEDIARRTGNLRPLWMRLSILGFKDVIDHFSKEEGRSGAWAQLSPFTLAARKKGKHPERGIKILQDSGHLRLSVHPTTPNKDQEIVFEANRVILRTNVIYASTHEYGRGALSSIKTRQTMPAIPKRSFMWVSKNARGGMQTAAEKWIAKGRED